MLTYPVNLSSRWTIIQASTNIIIARNRSWPRTDGMEIQGADPDFIYLEQVTTERPECDERLFDLVQTEPVIDTAGNTITTGWTVSEKPKDDVRANLLNTETLANSELVSQQELTKLTVLGLGIIARKMIGMELTEPERELHKRITEVSGLMWDNDATLTNKLKDLDEDKPIDPDAGWKRAKDITADESNLKAV